jgi:hypothetical protein
MTMQAMQQIQQGDESRALCNSIDTFFMVEVFALAERPCAARYSVSRDRLIATGQSFGQRLMSIGGDAKAAAAAAYDVVQGTHAHLYNILFRTMQQEANESGA